MIEIQEYITPDGRSVFGEWLHNLNTEARHKVETARGRMARGNLSNAKGLGGGVFEFRINFGPGYRIYFGREGNRIIILLGGGTKQRQSADISDARARWRDYLQRTR